MACEIIQKILGLEFHEVLVLRTTWYHYGFTTVLIFFILVMIIA
jgi:hypothetical protein